MHDDQLPENIHLFRTAVIPTADERAYPYFESAEYYGPAGGNPRVYRAACGDRHANVADACECALERGVEFIVFFNFRPVKRIDAASKPGTAPEWDATDDAWVRHGEQ